MFCSLSRKRHSFRGGIKKGSQGYDRYSFSCFLRCSSLCQNQANLHEKDDTEQIMYIFFVRLLFPLFSVSFFCVKFENRIRYLQFFSVCLFVLFFLRKLPQLIKNRKRKTRHGRLLIPFLPRFLSRLKRGLFFYLRRKCNAVIYVSPELLFVGKKIEIKPMK